MTTAKWTSICDIISTVMEGMGFSEPEGWPFPGKADEAAWAVVEQLGIDSENRCVSQPVRINSTAHHAIAGAVFLQIQQLQLQSD